MDRSAAGPWKELFRSDMELPAAPTQPSDGAGTERSAGPAAGRGGGRGTSKWRQRCHRFHLFEMPKRGTD
jgi:hypothetical protein